MYAHEIRMAAESHVLASLMAAPEKTVDIDLHADDFATDSGALIYAAIIRLIERKQPVNVLTLAADLQKHGELATIGGPAELKRVSDAAASISNLHRYIAILRESAQEIRLMRAADGMQQISADVLMPIDQKVEKAAEILADIERNKPARDPVHISDGVRASLKESLEREGMPDGWIPGLQTGLPQLDEAIGGLRGGGLIVVAGRTSMGKTSLAMLFAEVAGRNKRNALVLSLEMPAGELTQRMAAGIANVNLTRIVKGRMTGEDMERYATANGKIANMPIWIDDKGGQTADHICASARRFAARKGLELLIVDQLSLLDYSRHDSLVRGIGEATGKFKALAKELNIPVVVVAQLNREAAKDKTVRRPVLTDLQDSGRIEQDADVVLLVHRHAYYEPEKCNPTEAEIIIAKNRQGQRGVTLQVGWRGEYTRFVAHSDPSATPVHNNSQDSWKEEYAL